MLVIEKLGVLALNLNNPERVLECIPTARQIAVNGASFTAVPHKPDEVRVLRNLGIGAPAPILHYYDWPGRFTPFRHQKMTAAFLTVNQKGMVLNEIGTGKTQSALWAADYLMKCGLIKKVLILSPLSTLERVWGDAIFKEFPNRKFVTMHGTAERRLRMLKQDMDFYVINHDGFDIISDAAMGMFDLVIVDEAAVYRNPSTRKFRRLRNWLAKHPTIRVWLMTGTPTPNAPTDAWALAKLVDSPLAPRTFTGFRDQVMERFGPYTWVAKAGSLQTVHHILQPAVRYTRSECFDLPKTTFQTREVELTKEQRQVYDRMMKHFVVEMSKVRVAGGAITAVNEAVKLQKLVQIACGVAYNDMGENVELDCKPRVAATLEAIEEVGGKVIVFVPLTGTLHMLEREISKHWSLAVVNGQVSSSKRNEIFRAFQDQPDPRVLLAHPGTMSHGLTLIAASTIIWYGPVNSNEQYEQANGRIERIGKRFSSNVIHIEATQLERKMYTRLKSKQRMQGLLLDLIKNETD